MKTQTTKKMKVEVKDPSGNVLTRTFEAKTKNDETFEIIIENGNNYVLRTFEPNSKEWQNYIKKGLGYTIKVSKLELDFINSFDKKHPNNFIRVGYNSSGQTMETKFTLLIKLPMTDKYVTKQVYNKEMKKELK